MKRKTQRKKNGFSSRNTYRGSCTVAAAAASSGSCPDALWLGKVQRRGRKKGIKLGPNPNLPLLDTTHHQVRSPPHHTGSSPPPPTTGSPRPPHTPPIKVLKGGCGHPHYARKGPLSLLLLSLRGRVVFIPPPPPPFFSPPSRPVPTTHASNAASSASGPGAPPSPPPSPPCSSASSSLPRPRLRLRLRQRQLWQQRRRRRGLPSPPLPAAAPPGRD